MALSEKSATGSLKRGGGSGKFAFANDDQSGEGRAYKQDRGGLGS